MNRACFRFRYNKTKSNVLKSEINSLKKKWKKLTYANLAFRGPIWAILSGHGAEWVTSQTFHGSLRTFQIIIFTGEPP